MASILERHLRKMAKKMSDDEHGDSVFVVFLILGPPLASLLSFLCAFAMYCSVLWWAPPCLACGCAALCRGNHGVDVHLQTMDHL